MLTGFSEDAEVCTGIIKYAIACINTWIIQMEKKLPEKTTLYVRRSVRDSYAYGYIRGIKSALKQQREKHQEWASPAVGAERGIGIDVRHAGINLLFRQYVDRRYSRNRS